jgi:hypothetical protein
MRHKKVEFMDLKRFFNQYDSFTIGKRSFFIRLKKPVKKNSRNCQAQGSLLSSWRRVFIVVMLLILPL